MILKPPSRSSFRPSPSLRPFAQQGVTQDAEKKTAPQFEGRIKKQLSPEQAAAKVERMGEYAGVALACASVAGLNGRMNHADPMAPYLYGTAASSGLTASALYASSPNLSEATLPQEPQTKIKSGDLQGDSQA